MKKLLIGLLALGSLSVFGNDITDRIPVGHYKGSNDQGTCWVYVSVSTIFKTASVSVSTVGPSVRPSHGQNLTFSETEEYETARNSSPDILAITNLNIPNDQYTRKSETQLSIKNLGKRNTVKIYYKENII